MSLTQKTHLVFLPNLQREELKEEKWLQLSVSTEAPKSWAQYHIEESKRDLQSTEDIISLITLLQDKVNTLNMQVHTLRLNQKAVNALNSSQTPADVSDCPVFAMTGFEKGSTVPSSCRMFQIFFNGLVQWFVY